MKTTLSFLAAVLFPFLISCEQDAYDKGTGDSSLTQAELVEAYASGPQLLTRVVTDENIDMALTKPYEAEWAKKTDSAYRALLYFKKVEKQRAEPVSCAQVPTAVILPLDSFKKGVRQDPVQFESAWVSKTGRYLNTCIYLMTGKSDSEESFHLLAIADDSVVTNADGTRTQRLRLYHNQGGMPEYYSQRTCLSVPLHNVHADSVTLSVNTYKGVVTRRMKIGL